MICTTFSIKTYLYYTSYCNICITSDVSDVICTSIRVYSYISLVWGACAGTRMYVCVYGMGIYVTDLTSRLLVAIRGGICTCIEAKTCTHH